MAHAYTPGLRVTRQAVIHKQRRLPLKGQVLVEVGQGVRRDQVVARTELPGEVSILNLVNRLGITPAELPGYMLKKEGEVVAAGEVLAQTRPLIKWFRTAVEAPVAGTVESISAITGQVMIRQAPRPVEVRAYVEGRVVEVLAGEGVNVEVRGALVQGIFGVGGEYWGAVQLAVADPREALERVGPECQGKIVVGGSLITSQAIRQAREAGAVGVIGGGIRDQDLRELLGYDLGVAITGAEDLGLAVIATEGFGQIAMARKTFELLRACQGREASLCGATQIRAGVLRPELIVPGEVEGGAPAPAHSAGLQVGDVVRLIRAPHFGRLGKVSALPAELQQMESGTWVRALEVEFEDGARALVPRANVEAIEE
ncbi:MAG: hypothetical protein HYW07_08925 [Candidatus Latescibacteria bacterium]|nr:hypothetical protein [Candidatus Latescibacterota bacterium]